MPVVINGSTGISGTDGSAATPAIQGTDTNTGIFFPAADTIAFSEGGTEVMRIDSSGNVSATGALTVGSVSVTGAITAGGIALAPVINTQTFNSSGTWTKPSGYAATSRVLVQAWGGGGSGSRGAAGTNAFGGGGGSFVEMWLPLSLFGATETITLGTGGASRTGSDQNGAAGGSTTVGSLITALGGDGGTAGSAGGGLGDNFLSVTEIGGQANSSGNRNRMRAGAGGGNGSGAFTAGGTSIIGGSGGAGGTTGTAGSQPGGGGGAGTATSGAGGAGRVIITIFPA